MINIFAPNYLKQKLLFITENGKNAKKYFEENSIFYNHNFFKGMKTCSTLYISLIKISGICSMLILVLIQFCCIKLYQVYIIFFIANMINETLYQGAIFYFYYLYQYL